MTQTTETEPNDYLEAIAEIGMSHEAVVAMSENASDQIPMPDGMTTIRIGRSPIHGDGVFAMRTFAAGDVIAPARIGNQRTPVGRFVNHARNPNCVMALQGEEIVLVAVQDVLTDDELTVDYRQASRAGAACDVAVSTRNCFMEAATRDKIFAVEHALKQMPQADIPLQHYFADGMYARTIVMQPGTLLTGEIHKEEHFCILSKGKVSVLMEEGPVTISAPYIYPSMPGTKRVIYAHEESVWVNVHKNPTNERNIEKIEKRLVCQTYEQLEGAVEPLMIESGD